MPERQASAYIQNLVPDTTRRQDRKGNWIINRDEQDFYLNKPGLGYQDALNVTGAIALGGGTAKVASAIPKAGPAIAGWLKAHPILSSGLGGGTYSLAQQAAGAALTDEEMSTGDIARDTIAASVLPLGLRALVKPFRKALAHLENAITPAGELTKSGKRALEAAGIKHQYLDPKDIVKINNAVAKGSKYVDEVRGRKGALAADDIEATQGMIGQRPSRVKAEVESVDLARWSEGADNFKRSGDAMAPRTDPAEFGDTLVRQSNAEQKAAGAQFDAARRVSEGADVPIDLNADIGRGMRAALAKDLSPQEVDGLMKGFPETKPAETIELLGPNGKPIKTVQLPSAENPKTFRDMYEWRRQLDDPTGKGKAAFDKEMTNILDQQLGGDMSADAILAWRQANKQYSRFTDMWRAGDTFDKIITKDKQGYALRLDPENTWNLLFNATKAGFITKPGIKQVMRKMKVALKNDPDALESFYGAFHRRLMQLDELVQPVRGRQGISNVEGHTLNKHWTRVKGEWGEFLDEMYEPKVMDKMDNFVKKATWVDQNTAKAKPLTPSLGIIVNAMSKIRSATFRWARTGAHQAEELARKAGTEISETALGGRLTRPIGLVPPFRGAALAEMDEVMWDEVYNEILRDSGYDISEYVPDWVTNNQR
jgi:hypothetical protein